MTALVIAHKKVLDGIGALERYAHEHGRTLDRYDVAGLSPDGITHTTVKATRSLASRISREEELWFVERAPKPDWSAVKPKWTLRDADPLQTGGVFDFAAQVFDVYLAAAESGINVGKISKVLHLVRPSLFPVLDSRIRAAYWQLALDAAIAIRRSRPDFPYQRSFWAAIRDDLVANEDSLKALRKSAATHENARVRFMAIEISDVRLLDILVWQP
jgi:hypothetical protein